LRVCYQEGSGKPGWLEIKWYTSALVAASNKTGLEVNTDKTKCMVMSRDKNAGKSHSIKTDNSSFERVEVFKYLEQPY
jgi:hypothetical protein